MNISKKAFSLVEVMVTVILVSMLLLVISKVLSNSLKMYRIGQKRVEYQEKCANVILDFEKITRGATAFVEAEPETMTFYAYLKGDNNPAPSKISYYFDQGIFYRSIIAPVSSGPNFLYPDSDKVVVNLSDNVLDLTFFRYYNENGLELTDPIRTDMIRMVNINISVDEDQNNAPEGANQSTSVQLRNLKTNF